MLINEVFFRSQIIMKKNMISVSLMFQRTLSTIKNIPTQMKCIQLTNYSPTVANLNIESITHTPRVLKPDEALVRVHAASVNPFDVEMSKGYGSKAINFLREWEGSEEFPLILGRDCSGEIISVGKRFHRFKVGDCVYCIRWVVGQGTHAEYVVVKKNEISLKPSNINHIEASSFPYVACTTWNTIINTGAVNVRGRSKKRVFIPGGSGGLGSFAAQLCQAYGHDVVTSCAEKNILKLKKIGLKNVLNYNCENYLSDLRQAGPFDVILDTLNEKYKNIFMDVLKINPTSKYISLKPSLLKNIDENGIGVGLLKSGGDYLSSLACQLKNGKGIYHWGFVNPNGLVLDNIRPLIEDGRIIPLIDSVFDLDNGQDAYKCLDSGHVCGKVILKML